MSQSPFGNSYELPDTTMPERTSVMAVLSLVLGVVCVPFFGLIAIFLGVFALFGIKASRGRVSGTGLAVTGIVLGILATLLWGGCVGTMGFVANMARTQIGPAAGTIISAAQNDDVAAVRAGLTSSAQTRVTPEAVEAFASALTTEMGAYKGTADSYSELFTQYGELFGRLQQSGTASGGSPTQGYNNAMPIPLEFEKGWALVFIGMPQGGGSGGSTQIPIENIIVLTPSGAELVLVPFGSLIPSTPGADPDTSPDADPDAEPVPAPEPAPTPEPAPEPKSGGEGGGG